MKMHDSLRRLLAVVLILSITFLPGGNAQGQIPILNLITGAVKKVIRAIDLQVQRQQNKVIWLQNAQKVLENQLSKLKLEEISEWSEKGRELYDGYFRELWQVRNQIATFQKVKTIIQRQLELASEYSRAWNLLKQDRNFTPAELEQMYRIYSGILDESLKHLDQLYLVTNSLAAQMSDGKRLELINASATGLEQTLTDLRSFNKRNFGLSIARAADLNDAKVLKQLYGIE